MDDCRLPRSAWAWRRDGSENLRRMQPLRLLRSQCLPSTSCQDGGRLAIGYTDSCGVKKLSAVLGVVLKLVYYFCVCVLHRQPMTIGPSLGTRLQKWQEAGAGRECGGSLIDVCYLQRAVSTFRLARHVSESRCQKPQTASSLA